jgi:hypothetical protein
MIADTQLLENIVSQAKQLSPENRIRLIQRISETLLSSSVSQKAQPLQFGKYKGNRMSTLEDFTIAEWRPTDKELNGD